MPRKQRVVREEKPFTENGLPEVVRPNTDVNSDTITNSDPLLPNSISSENSTDGIHEFIFGRSTWITTTIAVTIKDIENYFEKQVKEKKFPKNAKLIVFCGYHGVKEQHNRSRMGGPFPEFTNNLRAALKRVEEKHDIISFRK